MRIANAVPGMILAQDIFDNHDNLLLEKGITLTESYINRLKQLGVRTIWIEDNAADALKTEAISPELRAELTVYFQALYTLKVNSLLAVNLRSMYLREIAIATDTAITQIEHHGEQLINLNIRQPNSDEISHALNVCLLSLVTGIYLKLPRPLLRELAMGALLHDIGKSLNSAIAAQTQATLHPSLGQDLLAKSGQSYGVCRIAAEHHECFNGTGFPARLAGKIIHPLARIVAVANYYDNALHQALVTDLTRQDVIETMMGMGNTKFDLNILRAFFHTIALYPVGSLVRLSTGQTGYVIKNHAHYPLRPLVRIITGAEAEPDEINLMHKPATTIVEFIKE
jgi:HD-GYP domain-containing protein (c-di-GMP phosphodiesterase class II)